MRSVILSLCLLFAGLQASLAQTPEPEWQWQNPLPTGNHLLDVCFVDYQTGWVVGSNGTILKTSTGGQSWETQKSGTLKHLFSTDFTDAQTGWTVGNFGTILKTSNGGQTWESQVTGTTNDLHSVQITENQTGWIVGNFGTILKTSNGGQTWESQISGTINHLKSVNFIDSQTGWAVGVSGIILKTSNGGINWHIQSSGTTRDLNSVHFKDNQNGWVVGNFSILKTTNGGADWISQGNVLHSLSSVYFVNLQTGWAAGGYTGSTIFKTNNGGQTWESQSSGTPWPLQSVHFKNMNNGWAVGSGGRILKTSNGGQSWQAQCTGTTNWLNSLYFKDAQTGWAVGELGTILKTSNGGRNWRIQNSGVPMSVLNSVHFISLQTGWVVGESGTILKTTNGGLSWQFQSSGTTKELKSVHFVDPQTGWVVGSNGTILNTTNGGSSWQEQISGTNRPINSVNFIDSQIGWAVGGQLYSSVILKTSDGGLSWHSQSSGPTKELKSVQFIDPQTGWVVGIDGIILKTSNGGLSWVNQSVGSLISLSSVYSINAHTAWAAGAGGNILKTTNGGHTWNLFRTGTGNELRTIFFIDDQTGWIAGNNGCILSTITSNILNPEIPHFQLLGKLFEKTGTDCNNTEIGIPYGLVKAEPGQYYSVSKLNGNFSLRVPVADTATTFTLSPLRFYHPGFQSTTVCPPSGQIAVTVDTLPDTLSGNNFGFDITSCHHLDLQISSNRRRRCFVNSTAISYWNQGPHVAPNAHVLVEFPHWVRPLSASQAHVVVNDSVWRFNLGEVAPGGWGNILIRDSVRCGNVEILGLSQCTKATIYPAPDCPPNNWSGAEVSVSGKCENGHVKLGIYNRTSVAMPDSVDYFVFLDSIQVRTGRVKLAAGDSLKLSVQPNGMGVYLSVNQVANHPGQVFVTTAVEGCGFFPAAMAMAVSTHLPVAQLPNSKTQCLPILGAYDPNDKQVFPIGFTNQNIVAPGTRLEYLVRFQNTGNDTAFTVYVIDTLDQNLNVESFEMGTASHPFELSMQTVKSGKTFLRWQFNNILLPDSNTNEPASNGFVQFRISPKPGLTLGSKVRNHAEIYFDFNPPIITNQTLSTYDVITFRDSTLNDNVQIVTSADKQLERELGVKLYPNPVTHNQLTAAFAEAGSLTLYDARGSVLFHKTRIEGVEVLPLSLKPGFYFATVETGKGRKSVKVVVE